MHKTQFMYKKKEANSTERLEIHNKPIAMGVSRCVTFLNTQGNETQLEPMRAGLTVNEPGDTGKTITGTGSAGKQEDARDKDFKIKQEAHGR